MGNFIFSVIKDYDSKGKVGAAPNGEGDYTDNNNSGEVVVIPVDGSKSAECAFSSEEWSKKLKEMKAKGEKMLTEYQKRMEMLKISGKVYSEVGRPGPMIIGMADQYGATMIVMGTRGMGFIRRSIVGSVSSYVIHHSDIPVMIVPRFKPHVIY